jgi:hypothetical protein
MQKVTVGHFVVRKLENPHILRTPDFSAAKLEKKSAKITRVNTVFYLTTVASRHPPAHFNSQEFDMQEDSVFFVACNLLGCSPACGA